MISLAGRDLLHSWGKFVFTGVGLGLLIGVTLTMAGVYRGMVDDAKVLLDEAEGTPEQAVLRAALFPDQRLGSSDPRQLYRACLDLLVRRAVERHFAELNREVARSLSAREQEDGTTSELKNLLERQGELRRCMARLKERPPGELEVRELVGLVRGVVGA